MSSNADRKTHLKATDRHSRNVLSKIIAN